MKANTEEFLLHCSRTIKLVHKSWVSSHYLNMCIMLSGHLWHLRHKVSNVIFLFFLYVLLVINLPCASFHDDSQISATTPTFGNQLSFQKRPSWPIFIIQIMLFFTSSQELTITFQVLVDLALCQNIESGM